MSTELTLRNLAIQAAKSSDWQKAVEHNQEYLNLYPNNVNAMNRLAVAFVQLDQIKEAKDLFKQVLELDKNNNIAKKNLEKLKNNKTFNPPAFAGHYFIEEPGKTKNVELFRLAGKNILESLSVGQACELIIKNRYISVEVDKVYIGALPEDLSFRLTKLIKSGNTYSCLVRSCSNKHCEVYLRETTRSKENQEVHSFPPTKVAGLYEGDEVVFEEDIPMEIVDTDTDMEKTLDDIDGSGEEY